MEGRLLLALSVMSVLLLLSPLTTDWLKSLYLFPPGSDYAFYVFMVVGWSLAVVVFYFALSARKKTYLGKWSLRFAILLSGICTFGTLLGAAYLLMLFCAAQGMC